MIRTPRPASRRRAPALRAAALSGALATLLGGCDEKAPADDTGDSGSLCVAATGEYDVAYHTEPSPAEVGGDNELWFTIYGRDGCPVDDIQENHERLVHTFVISQDLEHFAHQHMEDFYEVTADTLRTSTWHFPPDIPASGNYLLVWDFAHENQYLQDMGWMETVGEPAQLAAPNVDFYTSVVVDGVRIDLVWDTPARADYEAQWHVHATDAGTGAELTDFVQYLGADAHVAVVSEGMGWAAHSHAWFPGMEDMMPGMEMPHTYPGPDLPFHFTFPAEGTYKMWVQVARADAPDDALVVPFWFEVAP